MTLPGNKGAAGIIDLLEGVKTTGPDRGIAICPAHDDKSPSLHFKYTEEKLLVKCFSGCSFYDIAAALGVLPQDFFDGGHTDRREIDKSHRIPWRDAFEVIRGEMWVLVTIASLLKRGPLNESAYNRLIAAARRIEQVRKVCSER